MSTVKNVEIRDRKGTAVQLEKGRRDAVLRDFTNGAGESDPMVDFGGGYFVHVSTCIRLGHHVFNKDTGEELF